MARQRGSMTCRKLRAIGNAIVAMTTCALSLAPPPLPAQQISGNESYRTCTAQDDLVFAGFCVGYVVAQVEGQSWGAMLALRGTMPDASVSDLNSAISSSLTHCTPSEASNEQLVAVVVNYMDEFPELRHESARLIVWRSLQNAFPCPE
ncbi:Rap1a/Tai family immunity protein [Palleronia pelagia]|uniref:Rap1a/Tai family immunity protein n=1 Tax=Palleronia pelagia TaxID=387096 RepID=UPI0038B33ED9